MTREQPLPHWACVALVARCARLVLPAFDEAWPNAPARRRDGLLEAIVSAERSAAGAGLDDDHSQADFAATLTCGALRLYLYTVRGLIDDKYDESEGFPADLAEAEVAANAAAVAATATEAARAEPSESYPIAMGAVGWAIEVAKAKSDVTLLNSLQHELSELRSAVATGLWTHTTPVLWTSNGWRTG